MRIPIFTLVLFLAVPAYAGSEPTPFADYVVDYEREVDVPEWDLSAHLIDVVPGTWMRDLRPDPKGMRVPDRLHIDLPYAPEVDVDQLILEVTPNG